MSSPPPSPRPSVLQLSPSPPKRSLSMADPDSGSGGGGSSGSPTKRQRVSDLGIINDPIPAATIPIDPVLWDEQLARVALEKVTAKENGTAGEILAHPLLESIPLRPPPSPRPGSVSLFSPSPLNSAATSLARETVVKSIEERLVELLPRVPANDNDAGESTETSTTDESWEEQDEPWRPLIKPPRIRASEQSLLGPGQNWKDVWFYNLFCEFKIFVQVFAKQEGRFWVGKEKDKEEREEGEIRDSDEDEDVDGESVVP